MLEELLILQRMVKRCQDEASSRNCDMQVDLFASIKNGDPSKTIKQLRVALLVMAYGPEAHPRFEQALIHTLVELIKMIDGMGKFIQLYNYTRSNGSGKETIAAAKLQACLGKLFSWMMKEFKTHIPLNIVLPARVVTDNRKYIEQLRLRVKNRFKTVLDEQLLQVLLMPLYHFNRPRLSVTVNYFMEIFNYQRRLKYMAANALTSEIDIHSFLLCSTFQKKAYFNHRIKYLAEKALLADTATAVNKLYCYELKCIRQACCNRPGDHAGRLLITWLEAEIFYQEQELKMSAGENKNPAALPNTGKMHLGLSVDELGFAVQILMDEKIILDTNKAQVVKKIAEKFGTIKTMMISTNSLENKLYQVEETTRLKVKARVFGLLDRIRKYQL